MDCQSTDVIQITYGETVNLGNYQSLRLDVTVRQRHDESFEAAVERAQKMCWRAMASKHGEAQWGFEAKKSASKEPIVRRGRPAEEDLEDYVDTHMTADELNR